MLALLGQPVVLFFAVRGPAGALVPFATMLVVTPAAGLRAVLTVGLLSAQVIFLDPMMTTAGAIVVVLLGAQKSQ